MELFFLRKPDFPRLVSGFCSSFQKFVAQYVGISTPARIGDYCKYHHNNTSVLSIVFRKNVSAKMKSCVGKPGEGCQAPLICPAAYSVGGVKGAVAFIEVTGYGHADL